MNTMEWLILGAICLLVLICIFLIVFFCRRNRNDNIVKSRITRRASDDPEAPVAFLETPYRKEDNNLIDKLKTLNKKVKLDEDKKNIEDII